MDLIGPVLSIALMINFAGLFKCGGARRYLVRHQLREPQLPDLSYHRAVAPQSDP